VIQIQTPGSGTEPRIDPGLPELPPTDRASSARSAPIPRAEPVDPHTEPVETRTEPVEPIADAAEGPIAEPAEIRTDPVETRTEPVEPIAVADAVDPADTERLGDEIARLAAHLHAATYRMLVLVREFDAREGWSGGFKSCAHWLSWRTGIGPGTAREKVRVARALASLPRISAAMESGELSFSRVRALTRVATPENEEELLELARHATAAHIEKIVRAWRRVGRLEDARTETERHFRRFLDLHPDDDGSWVIRGRLDPEVGAVLERALAWASDQLYRNAPEAERRETTVGQRRADALAVLAEEAMAGGSAEEDATTAGSQEARTSDGSAGDAAASEEAKTADGSAGAAAARGRSGDRYQVVLHVGSWEAFHVSAETSRRLACDAGVVVMTHDAKGAALDVGRKRRTVPSAMRRALESRDGSVCRFPGCGVRRTDAHHLTHWADGGRTQLDNLVLLCRRHHRAVHEGGWSVRREPRAEAGRSSGQTERVVFYRPDGRRLRVVPRAPDLPGDPVRELERAHRRCGIRPDAWTATSRWAGERLDLHRTILALQSNFGSPPHPSG